MIDDNTKPIRSSQDDSPRPSDGSSGGQGASGAEGVRPPSISLPKGGGAIRGIGEKFAANPVTGTGTMSVPIPVTPGRSGFAPQLSLSYDSGAGNGPFGLGWRLSVPSITRKTDKGLPQYRDGEGADVFLLSGAEDLVPVLTDTGAGTWSREAAASRTLDGSAYHVHRYRPRVEGLFARIERWTNQTDPQDVFWRSISRENVTTVYGQTADSRFADPDDATRIFEWLISESVDDKGNAIVYEYKAEDGAGVDRAQAHEQTRTERGRSAGRYLKRIKYGNRSSRLLQPDLAQNDWLFTVVFDYGEGHYEERPPTGDEDPLVRVSTAAATDWAVRPDAFSRYRAGFDVRTYRLCRGVLVFHHVPEALGHDDTLVRSTRFAYDDGPVASRLMRITQSGYVRHGEATYRRRSLPALEYTYSEATVQGEVRTVDPESLENLPQGLDGTQYRWVDLDGEGLSGILTEQAGAWFYKANAGDGRFEHTRPVVKTPPPGSLGRGQQLMDLAGDGTLDLVQLSPPLAGFYERERAPSGRAEADSNGEDGWTPFAPFESMPNIPWGDPAVKLVDLTGDGRADVLIAEDEVITWYPSRGEEGFGAAVKVRTAIDEVQGPRLVFTDGTESIYLADLSGDGLSDLARIRNGEVCYWPNLGYGRFGAQVTMDNAPWFDAPDQFDRRRLHLADIDGSGVTDLIYLGGTDGHIFFNESGNRWSAPQKLPAFPPVDALTSVVVVDLLGNGTACLVWSSPLPGDAGRAMRYIDLMGGQKPHLLERVVNNLGAETRVTYAPSTTFYLADKKAGTPWSTRLPFPVHVVERVETYDHVSRNRFTTRYAYHHGYFDGPEREFRGFGQVEQWDTEELGALTAEGRRPDATNLDGASHVPPVYTKTWFHTGAYVDGARISRHFEDEYYREPGQSRDDAQALLLPDTVLPAGLSAQEEREACRALRGSMLRQEVYATDGGPRAPHPYTVTEQTFSVRRLQPTADNRHAVFFAHPREALTIHYERNPSDPRVQHALTLEVDDVGNVLRAASVGYGRRPQVHVVGEDGQTRDVPNPGLEALLPEDQRRQTQTLMTYTESDYTNPVDQADAYRTPLPAAVRTYELTGLERSPGRARYGLEELRRAADAAEAIAYEAEPVPGTVQKRLVEHVRTRYRRDDLSGPLPLGTLDVRALPFESERLALTPGLLQEVFGSRVTDPMLEEGGYIHSEDAAGGRDENWWVPSGRVFYSPDAQDAPAEELTHAREHFFLPHRVQDAFGQTTTVAYDAHDLAAIETVDPLGNAVRAELDYRVLQPNRITDPNGNRSAVAFDALGMVVGTAVMGSATAPRPEGDTLEGFAAELTDSAIRRHLQDPQAAPQTLLGRATTRLVYDLFAYQRTKDQAQPEPAVVCSIVRETHDADLESDEQPVVQQSFLYSDGFGREIQNKIQAEPGPLEEGGAVVSPRWVGSGWTIFNNKGKPVRQYEPFFSDTHRFEFGVQVGVSPVLFYDPVGRVVATLQPNHTYAKVGFDAWRQDTWDPSDTVLADPRTDDDVTGIVAGYFAGPRADEAGWATWHAQRVGGARGPEEQAAAEKAAAHAGTPTTAHLDALGRPFRTTARNRVVAPNHDRHGTEDTVDTRVERDIEGQERAVRDGIVQDGDPLGRVVMRYAYDLLGTRVHQASMEAGRRWMLVDVAGTPLRTWDDRGHATRVTYDALRRPLRTIITGADPDQPDREVLTQRLIYGEQHPDAEARNLRGQLYLHLDPAGAVATDAVDFKGNPLRATRRLAAEYKRAPDWQSVDAVVPADGGTALDLAALDAALAPLLESEAFERRTTYDALSRPTTLTPPHTPAMTPSVVRPGYNEAGLLERMDVQLRSATDAAGQPEWTPFVENLDYDAKGQRRRIRYGNGATTRYTYDPDTFRLTRLLTTRGDGSDVLQDLQYTYDPVGNITRLRDDAQQTHIFRGQVVEPHADYTYDALYRLVEATGREHLGQTNDQRHAPTPSDPWNAVHTGLSQPGDGGAMGRYVERYVYDAVGNFLEMQHRGTDPADPGWTRSYAYEEASLLEPSKTSNRLSRTTTGTGAPQTARYAYDAHGSMTTMAHLPVMQWNYRDQLRATSKQAAGAGATPETTYYVYDAGGQRVRKVTERQAGSGQPPARKDERLYLGAVEVSRAYESDGQAVRLERETLHVMDDTRRIALVETRTQGSDPGPSHLTRYQLANHLGSASLELDAQAQVLSYEEYTPYGTTSYQAVDNLTEGPNRYRFTGKERDQESGLSYHGARYYAVWLGKWTAADPAGLLDGPNLYRYAQDNPTKYVDPRGTNSWLSGWSNVSQEISDAYEAGTEIAAGMGEGLEEEIVGTAQGLYETVTDPVGTAQKTYEGLEETYENAGGGFAGAYEAAMEFNPALDVMKAGHEGMLAYERGDYREVGRQTVKGGAGVVDTVTTAMGGAGLAKKGLKKVAKDKKSSSDGGDSGNGGGDSGDGGGGGGDNIENLNPEEVGFSQDSVSRKKKDKATGEVKYTFDDIVESMKKEGWNGDPVDVVMMPDGVPTSIDNTRILAARRAGVEVKARVRSPDEFLTPDEQRRFMQEAPPGNIPETWGDAVRNRIQNQGLRKEDKKYYMGELWLHKFPYGSLYDPRINP